VKSLPSNVYAMRSRGAEGEVFYRNLLAKRGYISKYFPKADKEPEEVYKARPKVALPITASMIDRVRDVALNGLKVHVPDAADGEKWELVKSSLNWSSFLKNTLAYTLAGGNYLVALKGDTVSIDGVVVPVVTFEPWRAQYLFKGDDGKSVGVEYMIDKNTGETSPVLQEQAGDAKRQIVRKTYTPDFIVTERGDSAEPSYFEHNMGFPPAVWFKSIDMEPGAVYALPYPERFENLIIEYNQVFSQAVTGVRIFQNVWNTNKDGTGVGDPLAIMPGVINFLGENGTLEQAVRELNLEPEKYLLELTKNHISEAGQVPPFFTGLESVGKIEAGVAMRIAFEPLIQLVDGILEVFVPALRLLVSKSIKAQYKVESKDKSGEPVVEIDIPESVLPSDVDEEIARLEKALLNEWATPEEVKMKARNLLGFEEEQLARES